MWPIEVLKVIGVSLIDEEIKMDGFIEKKGYLKGKVTLPEFPGMISQVHIFPKCVNVAAASQAFVEAVFEHILDKKPVDIVSVMGSMGPIPRPHGKKMALARMHRRIRGINLINNHLVHEEEGRHLMMSILSEDGQIILTGASSLAEMRAQGERFYELISPHLYFKK